MTFSNDTILWTEKVRKFPYPAKKSLPFIRHQTSKSIFYKFLLGIKGKGIKHLVRLGRILKDVWVIHIGQLHWE